MKQSICSAEVDECTEIGNVLNNTLYGIAYMDPLEQLFLHAQLSCYKKLLAVTDDRLLLRGLNSVITNSISCPAYFVKILLVSIRYQAGRNEDSCLVNDYAQSAGQVPVQPEPSVLPELLNASSSLLLPFSAARRL